MANAGPVFPWDRLTSVNDYEVVDADLPHACDEAVAVWATTIGWPGRQEEMFRRYYLEYPDGQPELKFLRHLPTGKVVGTLGVGPRRVAWKGREIRAGMLSHFCVVAAHRKMRPPMFLFKSVIDACRGRYDALYAMPGTQESAPHAVALQRMAVAGVTTHFKRRHVKVLRSAGYAARVLPRPLANVAGAVVDAGLRFRDALRGGTGAVASRWADAVEPGMADLWNDAARADAWCASRDFAMLRWRFDRLPSHRRRHLLVSNPGGGPLLAWFACDDNHFDSGILVVQDYWLAGGSEAIDRAAIRALCRETLRLGYAAVEMRIAAPDPVAVPWIDEGFVERGREPVPVFWLDLDVFGGTSGSVHITEFDNDG
jgi:hypothetical protein